MNRLIHKDNTKEVKKLREEQLLNVRNRGGLRPWAGRAVAHTPRSAAPLPQRAGEWNAA